MTDRQLVELGGDETGRAQGPDAGARDTNPEAAQPGRQKAAQYLRCQHRLRGSNGNPLAPRAQRDLRQANRELTVTSQCDLREVPGSLTTCALGAILRHRGAVVKDRVGKLG